MRVIVLTVVMTKVFTSDATQKQEFNTEFAKTLNAGIERKSYTV